MRTCKVPCRNAPPFSISRRGIPAIYGLTETLRGRGRRLTSTRGLLSASVGSRPTLTRQELQGRSQPHPNRYVMFSPQLLQRPDTPTGVWSGRVSGYSRARIRRNRLLGRCCSVMRLPTTARHTQIATHSDARCRYHQSAGPSKPRSGPPSQGRPSPAARAGGRRCDRRPGAGYRSIRQRHVMAATEACPRQMPRDRATTAGMPFGRFVLLQVRTSRRR
jgi:hypothetical protein